jgi:malonate-semialdehyde dehydrogenase (acetylating)/methylmalonate-semialdehyde dehydrogenase
VERVRILFKFKALLEEHFEELIRLNTREHGKTLGESRGDVKRGIEMIEFACGIPSLLMGESLENLARGIDCETVRQPLGVCAGITPFNFPAMVPLWMYPVALACGNTFVLKPSEKVPLTAIRIVELLRQAGLPKGVLNLVHGGRDCVDALLTHPKIKAISFVGSTPVARHIFEVGTKHGKRVQSNGGAKNYIFIMPDADVENSTRGLIEAAYGCAGERCMAGSTAVVIGDANKTVLPSILDAARAIKIGPTDREAQPDMGPVITRQHRDRIVQLIDAGAKEGAKIAVDGRGARVPAAPDGFYVGATVLDDVQSGMTVAREEIFGPVLNVMRFADLDVAIELANHSPYGNGASIFTRSDGGRQHWRSGVDGLVPVQRLGRILFWRFAHARQGRRPILHPTKSDHDPLVQLWRRRHLAKVIHQWLETQFSFSCPIPGVKLGANALPAPHVQPIRELLNRQRRFTSQSRRQRQFVRIHFGSIVQVGSFLPQFRSPKMDKSMI